MHEPNHRYSWRVRPLHFWKRLDAELTYPHTINVHKHKARAHTLGYTVKALTPNPRMDSEQTYFHTKSNILLNIVPMKNPDISTTTPHITQHPRPNLCNTICTKKDGFPVCGAPPSKVSENARKLVTDIKKHVAYDWHSPYPCLNAVCQGNWEMIAFYKCIRCIQDKQKTHVHTCWKPL